MTDCPHCPLCRGGQTTHYWQDRRRSYLSCARCELVFVPTQEHLDSAEERAEYDLHQNSESDYGYRAFLGRLADPLLARLPAGARGMDFGCGPGPALAAMLEEAGHSVVRYDVFYAPDPQALSSTYDFITATEVVEHLSQPGPELACLWSLLRPGGWLGVMTKLVANREAFTRWHYKNDPTHISFFSMATWEWWAEQCGAELTFIGSDVMLLRKPAA